MYGRRWQHGSVAAALAAWIIVTVLGTGPSSVGENLLGTRYLSDLWSGIITVLLVIGTVVLVMGTGRGAPSVKAKRSRSAIWPLVVTAIALVMLRSNLEFQQDVEIEDYGVTPFGLPTTLQSDAGAVEAEPVAELAELFAGVAVLAVVVLVVIVSRRRVNLASDDRAPVQTSLPAEPDELVQAVDRAIDRLHLGNDPRSAVLAAYAELEHVLADQGFDRHPAQTAREHVTHATRSVPVDSAPFTRLAHLYDVARFSTSDVSDADRHAAATALAGARDELSARV